ncbi:MAG: hypothetical protein KAR39_07180 [Thermoplasmata archaeon]|nr:hypothetical protein [Thermoplasmata archaeon]
MRLVRGVSDACVEKMDWKEVAQTDLVDDVESIDVSTNDEVLAKMPKTLQISSGLPKQVRKTQPENTG